jgi:hypothetical protein
MRYRLKDEETGRLGNMLYNLSDARKAAKDDAAFRSRAAGRKVNVSVVTEGGLYLTRGGQLDRSTINVRVPPCVYEYTQQR